MFQKKPTVCKSCEKEIQTYEKAWIHMPLPANGMTNIKKYIELEGEVYCSSCIQIVNKKSFALTAQSFFSYIIDQLALLKLQLCLYVPMIDLHQYVRSGRKLLFVCKLGDVSLAF